MFRWLAENVWAHIDLYPPARERRKSGIILLAGFALLGALTAWRSGRGLDSAWARALWVLGACLGLGVMTPVIGRSFYAGLMRIVGIIGFIMNHVLMGLIFALVFTPAGLILKLAGKDLLDRRDFRHRSPLPSVSESKSASVSPSVSRTGRATAWRGHKPPPPKRQYHHLS